MQPPRMPGMGGEVRTFYFVQAATQLGKVTLVSLGGPKGDLPAQSELADACERIIEPTLTPKAESTLQSRPSRFQSWMRTMGVFALPWRNRWNDFLTYWLQYCMPNHEGQSKNAGWSKQLMAEMLRTELKVVGWFAKIPPLAAFMFNQSYIRIEHELKTLLDRETFDVLWIENTLTYPYANQILKRMKGPKPLVLCNAQNIETLVQQRIADGASSAEARQFGQQQTKLMRRMETDAYRNSDLVIQCSEEDSALGRKMAPSTEFISIANGVNTDYFTQSPDAKRDERPTIVFTAGFGYAPNREGLRFFLAEIYPKIQASVPECRFVFAGSAASEMVDELSITDPSVECFCRPDDIRPYFEQAWVYVVPLLSGGGTRLKILEAMSMERVVVSTTLGAEGIPYVDGEHLILADTPNEFAQQVIHLLGDEVRRNKIEDTAKRWVNENYDWGALCEKANAQIEPFIEHKS